MWKMSWRLQARRRGGADSAVAYRMVGRLDEAIDLRTGCLADRERVFGPDHPDTMTSRDNLAVAYCTVGRLDEAINLHTRCLADRERVLGPHHLDTTTSRDNLATANRAVDRLDDAEQTTRETRRRQ
jgi:hypothetical protein